MVSSKSYTTDQKIRSMPNIKIYGAHNTEINKQIVWRDVPQIYLEQNGYMHLNLPLMNLLGIDRNLETYILFVEDESGDLGICKTKDSKTGFKLRWYKKNTRARFPSQEFKYVLLKKFSLNEITIYRHFICEETPTTIGEYSVYRIVKCQH